MIKGNNNTSGNAKVICNLQILQLKKHEISLPYTNGIRKISYHGVCFYIILCYGQISIATILTAHPHS